MIDLESNGAIQVDEPVFAPVKVVIAGPISFWWKPGQWDTEQHRLYTAWRDEVRVALVKAQVLTYNPHRALQGAWDDAAQIINDAAIAAFDVLLVLTPDGIPAPGTAHEIEYAKQVGTQVVYAPPGTPIGKVVAMVYTSGRRVPTGTLARKAAQ